MTGTEASRAASMLALHTTDALGSLAVVHQGRITSAQFEAGGQHAPVLLGAVLRLLERAAVRLVDLAALAVTTGPGSFTGIRVGLATVQGLAAARGWDVWATDSLTAIAAVWRGLEAPLAVVQDARRGEVYAALFGVAGAVPEAVVRPFCAAPAVAATRLMAAATTGAAGRGALRVTGSGAALMGPHLPADGAALGGAPMPVAMALIELIRAGGGLTMAPQQLEPTYLRQSDAEVRRDSLLRSEPPAGR